jgi:hypothetical protein
MSDETFSAFITRDRERLHAERDAVFTQQHELERKLAAINNEMRAIDAYEAAKSGKSASVRSTRTTIAPSQGRRGSKREAILAVIGENPDGLTRGELLIKMGLKGDKTSEMSVSNALTALTKANQVTRHDGKYVAA